MLRIMVKNIRRVLSVLLLFAICLTMASCAKVGAFDINKKTVMTVDGKEVTYDEYKFFYYYSATLYGLETTDWTKEENLNKLKADAEYEIRSKYAIKKLCDYYEIKLTREDKKYINELMQSYIDLKEGKAAFREWLLDNRMTGTLFRDNTEVMEIYDGYLYDVLATGIHDIIKLDKDTVTQDVKDNFYRYTQILVKFKEGELTDAKRTEIEAALAEIKAGADFYEVADEYSSWGVNAEKGEYIPPNGYTYVEVEAALEKLEIGEMSEIIESDVGFHILMRLAPDEEYIANNYDLFVTNSIVSRYRKYLDKIASELTVEYTEYGKTLTFETLIRKEE